jgi:heptosyltransferase III
MKTFLICHRGALGDFLLTWPALTSLRQFLPGHRFLGVGRPAYLQLARNFGLVDSFFDMESPEMAPFFAGSSLPPSLGRPDGAALWLSEGAKTARLIRRNAALPVALIPPFPDRPIHVALHHCLAIGKHFPVKFPSPLVPYHPCKAQTTGFVLLHPGSGSQTKNYPPSFFLRLAADLRRAGFPDIAFLAGPVERERGLDVFFRGQPVIAPGDLSGLVHAVAGCTLYIGNDAGPSHLASLVGIRTVVLYRTTDPAVWGALGRKVSHIRGSEEGEVLSRVAELLRQGGPASHGHLFFS